MFLLHVSVNKVSKKIKKLNAKSLKMKLNLLRKSCLIGEIDLNAARLKTN